MNQIQGRKGEEKKRKSSAIAMDDDSDAESPRGWRERRNSTLTAISLLQLDPAPMDSDPDTPTEEKRPIDSLDAERTMEGSAGSIKTGSTMAPGLSGSGRGAIYYCSFLFFSFLFFLSSLDDP